MKSETAISANRTVYLMRALPACGKSFTAQRLAGEGGVICETDEYFYTQAGEDPSNYDYCAGLLDDARRWNFRRFAEAIDSGVSPIVVDRGNGLNLETREYAQYAVDHGYQVELAEPDSEWWQEIRVLLKYREFVDPRIFDRWADVLAEKSRQSHRVPASTIRDWMGKWRHEITVEEILKKQHD